MAKQKKISERISGLKPVKRSQTIKLRKKIDETLPRIVEAVEHREELAEISRYRELEVLKDRASSHD
ncbi:MAG: hypothetical protein IPM63_11675 [Acidobacteriota bacterium]|nr:MAG: hypothetical protein IPM63_11675 [Acidobacteriota bacterium]